VLTKIQVDINGVLMEIFNKWLVYSSTLTSSEVTALYNSGNYNSSPVQPTYLEDMS